MKAREFWIREYIYHDMGAAFYTEKAFDETCAPSVVKIHAIEKSAYTKLEALNAELVEALEKALSTVRTHAMQTYSKVSAREADEIEKILEKAKGVVSNG